MNLPPHGDPAKLVAFGTRLVLAQGDDPTDGNVGLVLGVTGATVARWRNEPDRQIKLALVDQIATRLGRHYSDFTRDQAVAS